MRVKILKDLVGMYRLCYEPGEEIDLPEAQAIELIETGHATPIEFRPQTETGKSKAKPEKR